MKRAQDSGKPLRGPLAGFARLLLPILRRRARLEGPDEPPRGHRHLLDGRLEGGLVGAGRLRRSAELANELQRRRADLVLRRRRIEVRQRPDVAAHAALSRETVAALAPPPARRWMMASAARRCKLPAPGGRPTIHDRDMTLWTSTDTREWRAALDSYDAVVARQGVARLPELDRWFRGELPGLVAARRPPHVTLPELVRLTEWKMARGVWRAPNLVLVRSNPADVVVKTSSAALAAVPHPTTPIATLAKLKGVGPATASAV